MEELEPEKSLRRARFVTGRLEVGKTPIYITSLHLDYRREPNRITEIEAILKDIGRVRDSPQV